MQAVKDTFKRFISGEVTLVIPVYQRNYDWRKENCEQLFNDIVKVIKNDKPHFIGTFVYQFDPAGGAPQEYVIIDGQQRITSIILFAKALYDLTDDADLKEDIRSNFIRHTTGRGLRNKCRLRPNEYDRDTFEKLMSDDGFDENNFSADEKISALYRNYKFFREKIAASTSTREDLCDATDRLNIVSISLDNENPQEIFESLNSTGLELSQADLVRNYLLMPLSYDLQTTLYKNYWLKIEELLRPSGNVEKFMVQYLITKRKSNAISKGNRQLSNKNLYELFKDSYKKFFEEDAEACLHDMLRYAELFKRCIFDADTVFADLPALDKKFYELTFLLKADNAPIILMYLLDRYETKQDFDEATFIKFVDAMISLAFRAKACKRNGIDQQFSGNVLARLDKENSLTEEIFLQAITFGSGDRAFPNDSDFQTALVRTDLQDHIKSDGFKYMLYSLERAAGTQNLPAYSDVAVEQILPKKPNAAWKKYLTERGDLQAYEPWLQALGNQTLVNGSEKGRGDLFDKKKIRYALSCFSFTRALSGYSPWTSKQIQARAKNLAAAALKVWTLPEEFNATIQDAADVFNLDSDFNAFTWTKPATLSVFGTEMKMPYWNHMLHEVAQQLYALDGDTFRRATQLENVPTRLFQTEPTNFKIDDNFYVKIDFDAKTCLRMMKILAENFDRVGGTNVKDEIWFTLKPQSE